MAAPQCFTAFVSSAAKLAIASQLGDQTFKRERGSVYLHEALLEDEFPLLGAHVVQHRVGGQRAASAAATTVQRMSKLVPPGERAEFVAALRATRRS